MRRLCAFCHEAGDARLTDEEQLELERLLEGLEGEQPYLTVPISRLGLGPTLNTASLAFHQLAQSGRDSAVSVLMTTFDLLDDVAWLREELGVQRRTPLTICAHPWTSRDRDKLWRALEAEFDNVCLHFPGSPHLSRHARDPKSAEGTDAEGCEGNGQSECSVHAKLILLEFQDRLRIVISSANLNSRFWQSNSEVVWVKDFGRRTDGSPWRDSGLHVASLLQSGKFCRTLSHCLAELLNGAPGNQRALWLSTLSQFSIDERSVQLIMSRPGIFEQARLLDPGQVGLRLSLMEESLEIMRSEKTEDLLSAARGDYSGNASLVQRGECWTLCLADLPVAFPSPASCKALAAAEFLGFRGRDGRPLSLGLEVELLATDVSEEDPDTSPGQEQSSQKLPLVQVTLKTPHVSAPYFEVLDPFSDCDLAEGVGELLAHLDGASRNPL